MTIFHRVVCYVRITVFLQLSLSSLGATQQENGDGDTNCNSYNASNDTARNRTSVGSPSRF
jgi:hypothetical protein